MTTTALTPAEFADLLGARQAQVTRAWLDLVRAEVGVAGKWSDHDLLGVLPRYLDQVARVLATPDFRSRPHAELGAAVEQGRLRALASAGYAVQDVAAEFTLVGLALNALIEGEGRVADSDLVRRLHAIGDAGLLNATEAFLRVDVAQPASVARLAATLAETEFIRKQLEAVVRDAPEPMVLMTGPEHVFTIVNPAYVRLLGRNPLGQRVREAANGVEANDLFQRLDRIYQTGEPFIGREVPFQRSLPDGGFEAIWVNVGYYPSRDTFERIVGVLAFFYDVSDQVRARQRVEASETRVRRFAEAMPQKAFIADANGETFYLNPRFLDYTGVSFEQMRGRGWLDAGIIHPDDVDLAVTAWNQAVASGQQFQVEYRLRRHDGEYRWHLVRAIAFRDAFERVVEWFGTNTDIHENKLTSERLQLLIDTMPTFAGVVRSDGTLAVINDLALKTVASTAERELDRPFWETTWWQSIPGIRERMSTAVRDARRGRSTRFDTPYSALRHGEWEERWFDFSIVPIIDADGRVREITVTGFDVTDRYLQSRELESARLAAENANEAKSAFLANMSHEIRTPLGAIMGFSDLARQTDVAREDLANYLAIIERNSNQVLRIIDDILDLAKVEAGKTSVEQIEFNLSEFIADFASVMGFRARDNGIQFEVVADSDLPDVVCTDPTRLRQILMNSVGNAVKFTARGSVHLHVRYADERLYFTIRDTGRGITPAQASKLFNAFVQADASTTRKFGGTGLGLVLTRRLCQLLGGDYVLEESAFGQGSKFLASVRAEVPAGARVVPRAEVAFTHTSIARPPVDTDKPLTNVRVLLVEDSPDNQFLIQLILQKEGVALDIAGDGVEGIEKALAQDYDVVLMDIQMPRMDGHEAVRTLRARGYRRPVLALTAHAMKEEADRARTSGFSGFLSKPIQRAELIRSVAAHGLARKP